MYPPGSGIKILGVTLPGAERVVELGVQNVGVLATQATTNLRAYSERVKILDDSIVVQEVAAPGLVDVIEKIFDVDEDTGAVTRNNVLWGNHEGALFSLLEGAISQFSKDTEALVLGCTHYPLIEKEILQAWTKVHGVAPIVINPGAIAAEKFEDYLVRHSEYRFSANASTKILL